MVHVTSRAQNLEFYMVFGEVEAATQKFCTSLRSTYNLIHFIAYEH